MNFIAFSLRAPNIAIDFELFSYNYSLKLYDEGEKNENDISFSFKFYE